MHLLEFCLPAVITAFLPLKLLQLVVEVRMRQESAPMLRSLKTPQGFVNSLKMIATGPFSAFRGMQTV